MIACPDCHMIQPAGNMNTGVLHKCPRCEVLIRGDVFPAFYRAQDTPAVGNSVQQRGEAECFNHPGRQAVGTCSVCGRLLCNLCEIQLETATICIHCLHVGKEKKKIPSLEDKRFLYDNLALSLAFWPMLFVFPTLVTAPAALFVSLRYWEAPGSLLPRSRFRFVLAAGVALLQMTGWFFVFAKKLWMA